MEKRRIKPGIMKSLAFLAFYAAAITFFTVKGCNDIPSALEQTIEKEHTPAYSSQEKTYDN